MPQQDSFERNSPVPVSHLQEQKNVKCIQRLQCQDQHNLLGLKIQTNFLNLVEILEFQEVLMHFQGGSSDSFPLHKFRLLCSLFSLLAICRDREVCADVGSEQNELLVSVRIFGSHQFHPHPPEAEQLSALSSTPFLSICLSSWLCQNTCHHICPNTLISGFKLTVFAMETFQVFKEGKD